jgi:hypothetical protein
MKLSRLLDLGRTVRVIGFDDAPFRKVRGAAVDLVGAVCADTRCPTPRAVGGCSPARERSTSAGASSSRCRARSPT